VLTADQQSRDVGTESFWYRFPSVPSTSSFNKTHFIKLNSQVSHVHVFENYEPEPVIFPYQLAALSLPKMPRISIDGTDGITQNNNSIGLPSYYCQKKA